MRLASLLSVALAFLGCSFTCAQEPGRSPLTSQLRGLLSLLEAPQQTERELPSYPLVIRVHEKALVNQAGDQVRTTRPVSCVVLGTPASGTSWTTGTIRVDTSSANNNADFLVTFQGELRSRTVGVKGPARIHSHALTSFVVRRHVTLSPLDGFRSQQTSIRSQTRLVLDDVQSTKPGLRGRLVRRIGMRRAQESQSAAEREVAGQVQHQLVAAFDQQLDQRVAELNRQLQTARYVKALFGTSDELSVCVSTADNCVQIAIGAADAPKTPVALPESTAAAPIEVWLHEAAAQAQAERLAGPIALLSTGVRTIPAIQTISMAALRSQSPKGIDVRSEQGWTILSVDSEPTSKRPQEMSLARRSSN